MADIALFEDRPENVGEVIGALMGTEHGVVAQASNLTEGYGILHGYLDKILTFDVVVLDGNLAWDEPAGFTRELPPEPNEPIKKNFLGRPKAPKPRKVTIEPEPYGPSMQLGRDARAIVAIMREFQINVPIIGYSSDPMRRIGVEVDLDIRKDPRRLVDAIEEVTRTRND